MICDIHVHLAPAGTKDKLPQLEIPAYQKVKDMPIEEYLILADQYNVSHSVVFPHVFPEISAREGTRYILSVAAQHPTRFIPFLRIDEDVNVLESLAGNVSSNGNITPCAVFNKTILNIHGKSVRDLDKEYPQSPIVRKLMERKFNGKCGRCELNRICGGCRAKAYGMTGNYENSDPTCWRKC